MLEMNFWMEALSWVGAITTLGSYFWLSQEKISCKSTAYQGITFGNNAFFVFYNIYKTSYSFAALNLIFAIIAFKYLLDKVNFENLNRIVVDKMSSDSE